MLLKKKKHPSFYLSYTGNLFKRVSKIIPKNATNKWVTGSDQWLGDKCSNIQENDKNTKLKSKNQQKNQK